MLLYNLSCYLKGLVIDFSVLISLFADSCKKIITMHFCLFGVSETIVFRNSSNLKKAKMMIINKYIGRPISQLVSICNF